MLHRSKVRPLLVLLVTIFFSLLHWFRIMDFHFLSMWDDSIYGIMSLRGVDWAVGSGSIGAFFGAIPTKFPPMVFISNAAATLVFGRGALAMRAVHSIWFGFFLWGCFRVGKKIGGYWYGLLSAALIGSTLHIYSGEVLMEASMFAAVSWSIYYLLEIKTKRTVKNAVFLGIFIAIGSLSKTTFIPLIGLAALVFLVSDWLENRDKKMLILAGVGLVTAFIIAAPWYLPNFRDMFIYARNSRYWAPHSLGPVLALSTFKKYFIKLYGYLGAPLSFLIILSLFLCIKNMLKNMKNIADVFVKHRVELMFMLSGLITFMPLLLSDNKNIRFVSPLLIPIIFLVVLIFRRQLTEKKILSTSLFTLLILLHLARVFPDNLSMSPGKNALPYVIEKLAFVSRKYPRDTIWFIGGTPCCNRKMLQFEMLAAEHKAHFAGLCPEWETSIDNALDRLNGVHFILYVKNPKHDYRTKLQKELISRLPKRFVVVKSWQDTVNQDEFYLYADYKSAGLGYGYGEGLT